MSGEEKLWAFFFACITIIVVIIASCITFYKTEQDKLPLRLVDKGVNPAVAQCIDVSWTISSNYIICSKVLANEKLTSKEAKELVKGLK